MSRSLTLKLELKEQIKALLPRNGFSSQQHLAHHLGLSRDVISRFLNGKPVDTANAEDICKVLGCNFREITYVKETTKETTKETKIDWGEAIDNFHLFERPVRTEELQTLKQWIIEDQCRIVLIGGMKGMGKAHLSYELAQELKTNFDYVIFRSVDQYQLIDELLTDLLDFLNDNEDIEDLTTEEKIDNLKEKMNLDRCLLILTNIEGEIDKEDLVFEDKNYELLAQTIAEKQNKSCLVVTSSIEPRKMDNVLTTNKFTRCLKIGPLSVEAIQHIFNRVGSFEGTEEDWEKLRETYKGNPFVLVNVAHNICQSFGGKIRNFINFGDFVFNGIEKDFLPKQLNNLSETERNVMYWLALYRHPINLFELKDIMGGLFADQMITITKHLRLRFFVESKDEDVLSQPPMIRHYLIKKLINDMTEELINNSFDLLNKFPLVLPEATIKVREAQEKFILKPILQKLKTKLNTEEEVKNHLKSLLHQHRNYKSDRYVGGNIFNLLQHLGTVENEDFSNLSLKNINLRGNLRGISLKDTKFANSSFENSMFLHGFSNVISVVFSPDGKWLAIGDTNAHIYIWEVGEGCPILHQIIDTNNGWVRAITFSPDSKIIASGGENGNISLWEVKTRKLIATFSGHLDRVRALSYSGNGQLLASGSDDQTIRIWDCNRKELITVLSKHQDRVRRVIFHPDQSTLISASQDNQICRWTVNLSEQKFINSFPLKENTNELLRAITISPDGKFIATGTDDGVIRFWDLGTGDFRQELSHNHNHWIRSLAFSPNGDKIASASEDKTICISDVKTGKHLHTLKGHNGGIWSIDFHSQLPWLLSGAMGSNVRIWNYESGECLRVAQGYNQEIKPITYSPNGKTLAVGTNQSIVYLKDSSNGDNKAAIETHNGNILSLAYSPNSQILIGGSDDTKLHIWDTFNKKNPPLKSLAEHKNWIRTVAYSPDGKFIATGSDDKTVKLWDAYSYELLRTFPGHTDWIQSICFHPTQPLLISGSDDGDIKFWDIKNLKNPNPLVKIFPTSQRQVWTVAVSPNGKLMASGSNDDNTICIWDLESESTKPIMIIRDHRNWISSVAFSPDSQWLASGSHDTSIRLWKLSSTEYSCEKILLGHGNAVMCVTFHPHEPILASSSKDGTIKRWNYLTGDCLSTWRSPRPYENMDITGVTGLNPAQKYALKTLGAIERL